MKTNEEIVARIKEDQGNSQFGFANEVLSIYLPWELAKEFYGPGTEEKSFDEWKRELCKEHVENCIKTYMAEYGWDKAQNHRGLSASRTVEKMRHWLWLLDDDKKINWDNYKNYGCPILKQICELYNLPIPDSEDLRLMAQGKPCTLKPCLGCGA